MHNVPTRTVLRMRAQEIKVWRPFSLLGAVVVGLFLLPRRLMAVRAEARPRV